MKKSKIISTDKLKLYKDINEWWHPEVDYYEMLEKVRVTRTLLNDLMVKSSKKGEFSFHYDYPQKMVLMIHHSGAWEVYRGRERAGYQQIFQFWNKQFNDALAEEIKKFNPKLILDIGAGDGRLAKILRDRGFNVVATDNFTWPFKERFSEVEKLDYKVALEAYQPDFVIGCWMPLGSDWTPEIRRTKSVKHYMIIGEVNGCCGGDWKTRKGWSITDHEETDPYNLCRTDDLWFDESPLPERMRHHSSVISFSRD